VRAEHEPVIAAVSDEAGSAEVDFRSYAAPMRSSQ
jgi:hypothetical protein